MNSTYFGQTLIENAAWWQAKWLREECKKMPAKDSTSGRGGCVDDLKREFSDKAAGEGSPWCAQFVSVCYRTSREKLRLKGAGKLPYTASTVNMLDGAKKAGLVVDKNPAVGAVFFRYRDGGGHVGIVAAIADDGLMTTIEGNSGNAVLGKTYKKASYAAWQFIHVENEEAVSAAAYAFREPMTIIGTLLIVGGVIGGGYYGIRKFRLKRRVEATVQDGKMPVPKGIADILAKHDIPIPTARDRALARDKAAELGDRLPAIRRMFTGATT